MTARIIGLPGIITLTTTTSGQLLLLSDVLRNTKGGTDALLTNTSGTDNTVIGYNACYNSGLSTNNYSQITAIGSGAGITSTIYSNCTFLGYNCIEGGNNLVQLGNSSTTTAVYGSSITFRSDARDKTCIRDTILGLEFINKLRPVDYKWNYRIDYRQITYDSENKPIITDLENDGSKTRIRYHHGLIAQEVEQVIKDTGIDFGGFQNHNINGGSDVYSMGYLELIGPMIKSIQELTKKINELIIENKSLSDRLDKLNL